MKMYLFIIVFDNEELIWNIRCTEFLIIPAGRLNIWHGFPVTGPTPGEQQPKHSARIGGCACYLSRCVMSHPGWLCHSASCPLLRSLPSPGWVTAASWSSSSSPWVGDGGAGEGVMLRGAGQPAWRPHLDRWTQIVTSRIPAWKI